jgi:hypothetical protein
MSDKTKKPKLRWKKNPHEKGLAAVGAGPRGYVYHDGTIRYATVDALGGGWRPFRGWYWVAGWGSGVPHYNSCNSPVATEEIAKKEAEEYVKKHL